MSKRYEARRRATDGNRKKTSEILTKTAGQRKERRAHTYRTHNRIYLHHYDSCNDDADDGREQWDSTYLAPNDDCSSSRLSSSAALTADQRCSRGDTHQSPDDDNDSPGSCTDDDDDPAARGLSSPDGGRLV